MALGERLADPMANYAHQQAQETSAPSTTDTLKTRHAIREEQLLKEDADGYPSENQHLFQPEDERHHKLGTNTAYAEDTSVMVITSSQHKKTAKLNRLSRKSHTSSPAIHS